MKQGKVLFIVGILGVILLAGILTIFQKNKVISIVDFDTCAQAGYPIMESYPPRCKGPNGKVYTQVTGDQTITVTGEIVCLPHKDREGPQTLECAFGIKDENGAFYGLKDPQFIYISQLPQGAVVSITGILMPAGETIYDIVGSIEIHSVENN